MPASAGVEASNGATMARYVAEGHQVTLVTCTAGERGQVLVPDLEHLRHDRDNALGAHRRQELSAGDHVLILSADVGG